MKAVSPIFEDRGRRESYLLALSVVLIFVFCTLIAYTAFASTEAEPSQTVIVDGLVLDAANAQVIDRVKTVCKIAVYKNRILGIFPNRETGEVVYEGIKLGSVKLDDLAQYLENLKEPVKYTMKFDNEIDSEDFRAIKVLCPLQDGEFEVVFRRH